MNVDHAEIARLLEASRGAHQCYRDNVPRRVSAGATTVAVPGDATTARRAIFEALRLRTEADTLDPQHEAPAWRDEPMTHDDVALLNFYMQQLIDYPGLTGR